MFVLDEYPFVFSSTICPLPFTPPFLLYVLYFLKSTIEVVLDSVAVELLTFVTTPFAVSNLELREDSLDTGGGGVLSPDIPPSVCWV